ncbi:hypothetical protein C7212DRAFT_279937 [Tuber magnatum]|uniref:Uncharacterized protein n=1 Tax=Tuber magnatum TaxID=42249 RepID=A0A317SNG1_9PEZI|nr:hypothetical protein C7212DRAFT_279937 [Tuber magnatum]
MGGLLSVQLFIPGDCSGNSGSNNTTDSNNTTTGSNNNTTTGSNNTTTTNNNNYYNHGGGKTPEDYEKVLQQLYPPGSGYESHRNRVPDPAKGTCTWVTDHPKYKEWLENKTSGLLWLSADPGCGKSVIASFLVKHLKTHTDATICYFFFKDDSEEQRSATYALRAILHQLLVQKNTLGWYAQEELKAKGSRFTEEVEALWNILVKAVAEGGCGDVICVVDALDECEERTLTPLIRQITRLPESQPSRIPLKFLVTSRPYHRIEIKLDSPETTIRLKGEEEVHAISANVNRVVDEGIKKLESHWGQTGRLEYLRDLLKSSADRTFLWVSLILEILAASQDDSREEFTKIVTTSPPDLAQFYTNILDKSVDPSKARRILHIVVAAAGPLTLREMNVAFRIRRDHMTIKDLGEFSPGFEKIVKNLCGLFVRVIDEKIYLVHQTAREFLIKGSSSGLGNWQYTLCSADSNFVVADLCISYLSLEDFENNPLPGDARRYSAYLARNNFVQEHALLHYVATHWPRHFRDSVDQQMELFERTCLICKPGSNRLLTWFTLHWNNSPWWGPAPHDFTHLMIASWLGQGRVAERLLKEGGDINSRSEHHGTALNIAAYRKDKDVTKILVEGKVTAYLGGKRYNIMQVRRPPGTK